MSVLINIEMPVSCRVCDLSQPDGVGWICPVVTGKPVVDSRIKTRHPRCPLVEIPAHGRLIDADALWWNKRYAIEYDTDAGKHIRKEFFWAEDVAAAPTIIPAEDKP